MTGYNNISKSGIDIKLKRRTVLMKKKAFIAPLCSALVVPGLGQIINEQLKKGVFLLAAVFGLLIFGSILIYRALERVFQNADLTNSSDIIRSAGGQDLTQVWYLTLIFGALWLYAVVDAFICGRAADRRTLREN